MKNIKDVIDYLNTNEIDLRINQNENLKYFGVCFSVNHIIINKCKFYIQFKVSSIKIYDQQYAKELYFDYKDELLILDLLTLLDSKHIIDRDDRVINKARQSIIMRAL